jgi:DNA-binding transcriptional ArsR family regulator
MTKAYDRLGEILYALQNDKRIRALDLLRQGKNLQEIPKEIGMSRTGFQKVLESYTNTGLTYRMGNANRTVYKVSTLGEKVLDEFVPLGLRIIDEVKLQELGKLYKELIGTYGADAVTKRLKEVSK